MSQYSQENTVLESRFWPSCLQLYEKATRHDNDRFSSVNIAKFLRTPFHRTPQENVARKSLKSIYKGVSVFFLTMDSYVVIFG